MRELGITFSAESVRLILAGRKSQTRRVLPLGDEPRYRMGDHLYVQEGYRIEREAICSLAGEYRADGAQFMREVTEPEYNKWSARLHPYRATPGRFMYKSLARIWVGVTDRRFEQAQEISPDDLLAEGCPAMGVDEDCSEAYEWWQETWDALNAKRGHPWEADPRVVVYEFERIEHG